MKPFIKQLAALALIGASISLSGCATSSRVSAEPEGIAYNQPQNGVVPYIWEEPMADVVDVPPGLDPEGHYYRPAHQTVVEIRQGRWQYYHQGQ